MVNIHSKKKHSKDSWSFALAIGPNHENACSLPYLWTAVLEELQELGDHDVQRPVQHVAVQDLGRVLADLLQSPKRSLRGKTESSQQEQKNARVGSMLLSSNEENRTETINGLLSFLPPHCCNPCLPVLQVMGWVEPLGLSVGQQTLQR